MTATITITDKTKTPANLFDIIYGATTPAGYSVTSSDIGSAMQISQSINFLSLQGGSGNASGIVYVGGSGVKNDGTNQGAEIAASVFHPAISIGTYPYVNLAEIYITTNTNNSKVNVEWY